MLGLDALIGHVVERAVIEDVAVLQDLNEGRTAMVVGALQRLAEMLLLNVDRTGDKGRMRSQSHSERVEGKINRTERSRLGDLAHFRGRRVLALGQSVDAVVEEQDLEVDVATEHVN